VDGVTAKPCDMKTFLLRLVDESRQAVMRCLPDKDLSCEITIRVVVANGGIRDTITRIDKVRFAS
jgi:hypothetical protein